MERQTKHNEGESTDDEEVPSKIAAFTLDLSTRLAPFQAPVSLSLSSEKLGEEAEAIFADALPEFASVSGVLGAFERWLREDPASFNEAYIGLTLPKLLTPLVQLRLLTWNPLATDPTLVQITPGRPQNLKVGCDEQGMTSEPLEEMEWHRDCLLLGGPEEDDPSLVALIPNIVDKVVLPHLTGPSLSFHKGKSKSRHHGIAQVSCEPAGVPPVVVRAAS